VSVRAENPIVASNRRALFKFDVIFPIRKTFFFEISTFVFFFQFGPLWGSSGSDKKNSPKHPKKKFFMVTESISFKKKIWIFDFFGPHLDPPWVPVYPLFG